MSAADFLRLGKLKGVGIVKKAARHNRRAIQAEQGASGHIDPTRSHLNETLTGPPTADEVALLARRLMDAAGIEKPRKNAVLALELIFSLPADHKVDDRLFFADCLGWAASRFGGAQNILSADIHRDEAAPHCHVLILPLSGNRLVGSDMVGNRNTLLDHRQQFYEAVSARYGLAKAPPRLAGATKTAAASTVLASLRTGLDGAMGSKLWPQFRANIERDPGPYLLALGLDVARPPKRMRTMTQIFTSKGKGKSRENNPIGFLEPPRARSLSCVGNAPSGGAARGTAAPALMAPAHADAQVVAPIAKSAVLGHAEFKREREDAFNAEMYDPQTGDFIRVPTKDGHKQDWPPDVADPDGCPHWDAH